MPSSTIPARDERLSCQARREGLEDRLGKVLIVSKSFKRNQDEADTWRMAEYQPHCILFRTDSQSTEIPHLAIQCTLPDYVPVEQRQTGAEA